MPDLGLPASGIRPRPARLSRHLPFRGSGRRRLPPAQGGTGQTGAVRGAAVVPRAPSGGRRRIGLPEHRHGSGRLGVARLRALRRRPRRAGGPARRRPADTRPQPRRRPRRPDRLAPCPAGRGLRHGAGAALGALHPRSALQSRRSAAQRLRGGPVSVPRRGTRRSDRVVPGTARDVGGPGGRARRRRQDPLRPGTGRPDGAAAG